MRRMRWMMGCWVATVVAGVGQVAPEVRELPAEAGEMGEAAGGMPSADELKAKRAEVEGMVGLSDEQRQGLMDKFGEVQAAVERVQKAAARSERMRKAMASAAADLEGLATEAAGLVVPEDAGKLVSREERGREAAELKSLLTSEESALEQANNRVAELKASIAQEKARPGEIPGELEAAQKGLREAEAAVAATPATGDGPVAEAQANLQRMLAEAQRAAARAEISMLEQERLSTATRLRVLEARGEVAQRKATVAEARVKVLRAVVKERVEAMASAAVKEAAAARQSGEASGGLADEVSAWSRELQRVTERIAEVQRDEAEMSRKLDDLAADIELVERQVEVGGAGSAAAQVLLEQRRVVPDPRRLERELRQHGNQLAEARLARIRIDGELRKLPGAAGDGAGEAAKLAATKRKVLEELSEQYELLIREQGQYDLQRRSYLARVREFREFLDEKLFWVPSSPRLGVDTFRQLPAAVRWFGDVARWREPVVVLGENVRRSTVTAVSSLVLVGGLLLLRPRLRERLARYAKKVRRVSTDRYSLTVKALLVTLLLALPWPLLVWMLAGRLWTELGSSDWSQGVAVSLFATLPVVAAFALLRNVCLPDGLAEAHFRWRRVAVQQLRRGLTWVALLYVPAVFVIIATFSETSGRYAHTLGRVTFMVTMAWVALWFARMLRPSDGVLSGHLQEHPEGGLARLKVLWYPLLVVAPLGFAGLAAWGYLVTGLGLSARLHKTVAICLAGLACYALILRWFVIRERRIALEQALAERKARREAAEQAAEPSSGEEAPLVDLDDDTLDLVEVGAQTRRLLRAVVGGVVLALFWLSWGDALPVLRGLEGIRVLGQATAADILLAVLIVVATTIVAKNLPGILEIALLRKLTADGGVRYAVASLAQYTVVAIGAVGVFQVLAFDWSKFSWILAALSVGLGFGLQEVVANFVCGIVLLFERPIRVGDVVTVGEVTGTVSRIEIRATTITDWDRKEFVVPNKQFITGQVLNWTLSNTVNRLVLNVGAGYGSDTARVRALLEGIVAGHPEVLREPAPVVTLERLGESSLDFSIRCFLPSLDRRLAVTHELLSQIHRRFGEEGIEIPFPQRQVHVRGEGGVV